MDVKEIHDPLKETLSAPAGTLHREQDSLDDFEHLGHDSSPLNEKFLPDLKTGAREEPGINKGVGASATNPVFSEFDPLQSVKMDSNLLDFGDYSQKKDEVKVDKFLQDIDAPLKHEEGPEIRNKDDRTATQAFMDFERAQAPIKIESVEKLDKYSDSEPEDEDFKPTKYEDFQKKAELPESVSSEFKPETYKDLDDLEPELPQKDYPVEPEVLPSVTPKVEPVRQKTPEPVKRDSPEPVKQKTPEPVSKVPETKPEQEKKNVIDAEAIFCRMGLDAWFNPERLNPKVESLIYWRDPKKSGPVFGGVLVVLLALTYFSLISVVAYLSLLGLTGTISFRIYKNIVQAVQKTGDGHPFKDLLALDVSLPQDKVKEVSEVAVAHINAAVVELRRLFLVEDLVDSIKFGVLLWTLTYLGSWFNGMTLIIIAWVALFTLPKVYEANKTQIDANLEIVRTKLAEITSKVKAAIPIGKKAEEKKEQ